MPEKLPLPVPEMKVTVPVGVAMPAAAVSVTVAVQDVAWLMATVPGEQVTTVLVEFVGCSGSGMMFSVGTLASVTANSKVPSGVSAAPSSAS